MRREAANACVGAFARKDGAKPDLSWVEDWCGRQRAARN
jgi:hypothetical protein